MAKPRVSRRSKRVGRYRSPFEAAFAADLDARGISFRYEEDELFYESPRMYTADFVLGNGVFIEVKGYFPAEDRRKMLEVQRSNPDVDLRLVFQSPDKKISNRPKSLTYAQWADRYGFKWAKGKLPEAWRHPQ